jgi:hypothetical protein
MNVKNTVGLLGLLVLTVSLSGCFGHKNPLKVTPAHESARFLMHASKQAEKQLGVYQSPGGYYYGHCMEGQKKASFCHKLYADMAKFADKSTLFKGLTVDDLTSKSMWKSLSGPYHEACFDQLPD